MTAWLIAFVLEAALRALALAAVVGLALGLLRVRNVPARKTAWTLVLLASCAMPLLMRAVPPRVGWVLPIHFAQKAAPAVVPQPLPAVSRQTEPTIVPPAEERVSAAHARGTSESATASIPVLALDLSPKASIAGASAPETQPASTPKATFRLPSVGKSVVWIYFSVAAVLLFRLGIGLFAALRLWITADLVSPLIAPEPNVRSSSRIASPVTIGSGIVLPADYRHWDARKLRMVMAHERSHVLQLDFYLQLLAGLYAALLWFSPLGWWLRRTLSALGETISDRAGLSAATSRAGYANLVLEFAALPHKLLPGVAMACSSNLSRRVDSMLNESLFRALFSEGRRRAMASLLVVPAALFAVTALVRVPTAAAQAAPQNTQQNTQPPQAQTTGQSKPPESQVTTTTPAPDAAPAPAALPPDQAVPAPATPPMPPAPAAGVAGGVPGPAPAAPDMPPAPAAAPIAPDAYATSIGSGDSSGYGVSTGYGQSSSDSTTISGGRAQNGRRHAYTYRYSDNGDSWALVENSDKNTTFSGEFNGEHQADIEKARKMAPGSFLWFTRDGKSYIVTDPAILARIQKMEEPIRALGDQQAALGKQQEALGRMQEDMARTRSQTITIRMPDLSKEMADVNAQIAQMKNDQYQIDVKALADLAAQLQATVGQTLTQEKLAEIQEKIASIQVQLTPEKIAEMQAKLGKMQARLGALQGEAGAKEGELGERMGELGEKQGRLGEQQGLLGEQQGRLSEQMDHSVQQIIDEALKNGTAKSVQ